MPSLGPYTVLPIGLGLMSLTWTGDAPDEVAFEVIKTAIEANSDPDVRVLLNGGAFHNKTDQPYANLTLLRRFFKKYPDLKEPVVLNIKGGIIMMDYLEKGIAGARPSSKLEDLRTDIVDIRAALGSDEEGPELHFYEPCRRDPSLPIEEIVKNLATLQKEGLFQHTALSELGAESINKAAEAAKELGTKITSVELEYSPFLTEIEDNGVLDASRKHGIPILAYSPLGKGFLGGKLRDRSQVAKTDHRLHLDTFSEENFPKNVALADTFSSLAEAHSSSSSSTVTPLNSRSPGSLPKERRPMRMARRSSRSQARRTQSAWPRTLARSTSS